MLAFFHSTSLAVRCFQTGSRDTNRHRPEGSHQLALAMAVPVASPHNRAAAYAGFAKPRPFITVPPCINIEIFSLMRPTGCMRTFPPITTI